MKKFKSGLFSLLVLFTALVFMTSCEKEALVQDNDVLATENIVEQSTETEEIYLLDMKEIPASDFTWEKNNYIYHTNIGEKKNPNSRKIYSMAFTTKEKYDNFMYKELGEKYLKQEEATKHLADYAVKSGAVKELDETGKISESYLAYEAAYLKKKFPELASEAQQKSVVGVLFKHYYCDTAFNISLPLLGTPFFIFNNNKASSFEGLLIGGHHKGFDKSFYRKQIYSITTWALFCNNMGSANDRVSSWWSIGL